MIILVETGRVGNQLLQMLGVKEFFSNETILFVGFDTLSSILDADSNHFFINPRIPLRWVRFFMNIASAFNLISTASEASENSYYINHKEGLIRKIVYLKYMLFEKPYHLEGVHLNIKKVLIEEAKIWLSNNLDNDAYLKKNYAFLHVRRGDYLEFPSKESPAVLDQGWYLKAIGELKKQKPNIRFIVLSDDIEWCREAFENENFIYSNNSVEIDFAIMTLCENGILSASSLSFCGAYISYSNNASKNDRVYLAPKYWIGHRKKEWYPKYFINDWIEYL